MVRVITDTQEFESIFPAGSTFWTIDWHDANGPVGLLGPYKVLSFLNDENDRDGPKVFVRTSAGQRQTICTRALTNNFHGVCATKADAQVHLEKQ